jgi:hypothetical protein
MARRYASLFPCTLLVLIALTVGPGAVREAHAQPACVYELRTYTAHEGRLDEVVARFRNYTTRLFEKHGMINVGYWIPREQPNTLIHISSHASRDAAT